MQNLKKGTMTMADYILKMRGFADCLIAAGQITTDQNVIMSVLNDLGLEYDPVVVHFTSREDYVSLSEAQYILMSQEQRLARLHSAVSLDLSNATANLAYGNNQCNQCGGCRNNRVDRGRNSGCSKLTCQLCDRLVT
ncbi:hypothetical protein JRO89_XS11G0059800 [Xanthoceras sorbifolium]|uniref:Uncharacterized protein n=1 Tax=Xanthoceras sorbifolium TaxID=99658 RepID=A0ABQ8HEV6_9ROSI|nr:hypothetical protein JRO89_XS11G0059800 [Xanthoceras sorbifolium]